MLLVLSEIIILKKNRSQKKKKYKINTLISESISSEENQKEKQIKDEIIKYSNKFMSSKDNNEKMLLINKYNEAIFFSFKNFRNKGFRDIFQFHRKIISIIFLYL